MKIKLAIPIKVYRVKSSQKHPDIGESLCLYRVELYSDGNLHCDCPAGRMKRVCKHKMKVYEFIRKNEPDKNLNPIINYGGRKKGREGLEHTGDLEL